MLTKDEIYRTVFKNRGIDNYKEYINIDKSCLCPVEDFKNIQKGINLLVKHETHCSPIHIVVDCDVDGYCSAAMIYDYIAHNSDCTLTYSLHTGKQHGLDDVLDEIINSGCKLVILPDGGTNDIEQQKVLQNNGIEILILDHHIIEQPEVERLAVIINSNDGSYKNIELCGAGVVYKFLQYLDAEVWGDYFEDEHSDRYKDLLALALIGDDMNVKESPETRYLIQNGLYVKDNNLIQQFLFNLITSGKITDEYVAQDIAFYLIPLINAMIRMGTMDNKKQMFQAFVADDDEVYTRRSRTNGEVEENIYEKVVRECVNAKARQDRLTKAIVAKVQDNKNAKILMFDISEYKAGELTGLIANKVASMYHKPCIIYRYSEDEGVYRGSGRIEENMLLNGVDFREYTALTELFDVAQGHPSAFGVVFQKDKLDEIQETFKHTCITHTAKVIYVDFTFEDFEDMGYGTFNVLRELKQYYGHGFAPVTIRIQKVYVAPLANFFKMGQDGSSWKICDTDNNITYCKFNNPPTDELPQAVEVASNPLTWHAGIFIDVVGEVSVNFYGGRIIPQIIVSHYKITGYDDWNADWDMYMDDDEENANE